MSDMEAKFEQSLAKALEPYGNNDAMKAAVMAGFERARGTAIEALTNLKKDLASLQAKYDLAEAQLCTRPYVEILERKVFPAWLLNADYPTRTKWSVSLKFKLTVAAKVLRARLQKLEIALSIEDLSDAFVNLFDVFSETVSHNQKPRPIRLTDDLWSALFSEVGIHEIPTQTAIRKMLSPIEVEEYNEVKPSDTHSSYIIYVNNVCINLKNDGENETARKIKASCQPFGDQMIDFYFVLNARRQYTNEVFIHIDAISEGELDALKKSFSPRDTSREVFFRYNKIWI